MGSMHLDSRQVFSEFIGFLAGERVLRMLSLIVRALCGFPIVCVMM